ncbi:MAG: hypothetical protein HXX15_03370 [Rhodopseudomonas sp.]|uniref:hypothetical protein n=1 Tax=Rhodopseudomonas sp. TaxID=1078 RepID=UPI0017F3DBBA|nr:hypothetical protein [Rhodopseudomonas sp.]NVN85108.1 hypothetical protein [Rhodopseudomonas sp.]
MQYGIAFAPFVSMPMLWIALGATIVTILLLSIQRRRQAAPKTKSDPWGCMAGTITIMPDTDLTAPTGDLWNAEQGRLLNE